MRLKLSFAAFLFFLLTTAACDPGPDGFGGPCYTKCEDGGPNNADAGGCRKVCPV